MDEHNILIFDLGIHPNKKVKDLWMGPTKNKICCVTYSPKIRLLFGVDTVKKRMSEAKFHIDSFFTGADFPHSALVLIETAIRRRHLDNLTSCGYF